MIAQRPIGGEARRLEEEKLIIKSVTDRLKENQSIGAGHVLADAISKFASIFATGLQEWKDQQVYNSAAPDLKKRYDDLCLRARIQQLEKELGTQQPSRKQQQECSMQQKR